MKSDAILLTPITPRRAGLGLAMRADQLLRALATRFRLHLRVVPLQELNPISQLQPYDGPVQTQQHVWSEPSPIHRVLNRGQAELGRITGRVGDALVDSTRGIQPSHVVVFRHCLLQLGQRLRQFSGATTRLIVDIDELESVARARLAGLHGLRGESRASARMATESRLFGQREALDFECADQVWVSSEREAARLRGLTGTPAEVIPNVVSMPHVVDPVPTRGAAMILFVGGLGYLPNLDAAQWMATQVVPHLRKEVSPQPLLRVVGRGPGRRGRQVDLGPGVAHAGYVESLAQEYAQARLCVAPIRAGGGTRIKILEALAHGRPVVSTTVGAEGLGLEDGQELKLADSAIGFAQACASLIQDPLEAQRLAERGRQRVAEQYSPLMLQRAVDRALAAIPSGIAASPLATSASYSRHAVRD